ncbi:MAG: AI-2E family transporter [Candidatus Omnitrophica bacterium]|nr:AI-2E family transporter [Candidatus Omnitrophota bacterium]
MNDNRVSIALLGTLTLIAVGFVLKAAQSVIVPLFIAVLLSFLLAPAVDQMARRRIPRWLAITAVLIMVFAIGYVTVMFLNQRVAAFTDAFPRYHAKLMELISTVTERFNMSDDPLADIQWGQTIGGWLVTLSGSVVSILSNFVLIMIFTVFMLSGEPYFRAKVEKAFSQGPAKQIAQVISSISRQISRYLWVQFLISFATGLLVWIALSLIGVDFAVTWGALAFLLNFIPTIGSIIASIPPILLALVQFYPSLWPAIAALSALLTIQMVIGNGIAPKVLGDSLNLSPVVVLISLLFWGWLWGFVGALLSVPIAAGIKIVCENVEGLRPISVMMGSGKTYAPDTGSD